MALKLTRQERQQSHIHRWLQKRKPAFGPEFSPGPVIDKRQCDQARHGYRKARTRREVPTSMPAMGGIRCFAPGLIHRQLNAFKAFTSARISPYRGHEKTGKSRFFHASLWAHSHSIVAGGLLDTSYVTREIPSISLMIRPLTVSSSS